jgi:heptaprenyl diphosphate synthase
MILSSKNDIKTNPEKSHNPVLTERTQSFITHIAILAAFSLFLSTVEYMIPKPLPFMRIGLANLPIIIGLSIFSLPELLLLSILKIVGQGLINGTIFSYIFLFSAGGSLASMFVMYIVYKLLGRYTSFIGISIAGAVTSNAMQLFLAHFILFGSSIWVIAPPFLLMGFITSIFLGVFANVFTKKSRWYADITTRKQAQEILLKKPSDKKGGLNSNAEK